MRDIAVTLIVFGSIPFILRRPYIGVLMWTWISFMNPHRLTWSWAYDMPFALYIALATLVGMLLSREPKRIPWTRETVVLLAFVLWMVTTTIFSYYPSLAWTQLEKVAKIQLMIFVTLILMQSKERIIQLVAVMAISLGFYGVKGGIFTILTGGAFHVRGPEGSFIGGDNEIGLALIMTVPLLRYFQLTTQRAWLRHAMTVAMLLTAVAVVGSQSRGAALGVVAMGFFLWLKSRNRFFTAVLAVAAVALVFAVMPQQWFDRMASISNYQTDSSAQGRINAWNMAFNLAKDRPFGGGFECFRDAMFARYAPKPGGVHDAHSIYFEVMGEHGFVGFALFVALGLMTWFTAGRIAKRARLAPENRWAADLATMIQVSLIGYATAGAFLGLAYFDFYYTLVATVVLCKTVLVTQEAARRSALADGAAHPAATGRTIAPQRAA